MAKLDDTSGSARRVLGVVRGVVIDNQDPSGLGRVRISVPMLTGEIATTWAAVSSSVAGKKGQSAAVPELGEEVVIAFEDGDVEYPIILGVLRSF